MSESTLQPNKIALLRDRLYIDGAYVTDEMYAAYQIIREVGKSLEGEPIIQTINHFEQSQISQGEALIAFNRGDMSKLYRIFSGFDIRDERLEVPMKAPLKIKFPPGKTWRSYQPDAVGAMLDHEYGLLQAPPRSGKTLMMAADICTLRQKSIVFAHQTDLLLQLYDTFEEFTNLKELRAAGNPVVGFCEDWDDFEKLDVVLCTKQTFDNVLNRPWAKIIQKLFGAVYVDEAHFLPGEVYSKLINRFWAKYRRGYTATPHRKDGLDIILDGIMGPVIHQISRETVGFVPMKVSLLRTGIALGRLSFVNTLTELAEHTQRNNFIFRHLLEDVKLGHYIIAVTDRKQHGIDMMKRLQASGVPAAAFNGNNHDGEQRKKILGGMRSGDTKVLIVMRSMCTGLDIPRADCFHNLLPSANAVRDGEFAGEGGYEQQCTRIMTPFPGKTVTHVRDYVDSFARAYQCLAERKKTYARLGAILMKGYEKPSLDESIDYGSTSSTTF
jgi:superfamily II DNA or RNA helicase